MRIANSKDICIVGNEGSFDIVEKGYAWDKPVDDALRKLQFLNI